MKNEIIRAVAVGGVSFLVAAVTKTPQPLMVGGIMAGVVVGSDMVMHTPTDSLSGNTAVAADVAMSIVSEMAKQPIIGLAGLVVPMLMGGNLWQGLALGISAPLASIGSTIYIAKTEISSITTPPPDASMTPAPIYTM